MRKTVLLVTIFILFSSLQTGCSKQPEPVANTEENEVRQEMIFDTEDELTELPLVEVQKAEDKENDSPVSAYKYSELERVLMRIKEAVK